MTRVLKKHPSPVAVSPSRRFTDRPARVLSHPMVPLNYPTGWRRTSALE